MTASLKRTVGDVLLDIETGKSVKTQERPAREGELGILKVSAVTWGSFRPHENKAVLVGYDPGDCPRPRHGDLLISRANTRELVGAPVIVKGDHPNLLLSDKILRLIPDKTQVNPRYLAHALRSASARAHLEGHAGGTSGSMTNITQDNIRSTPLLLPSLPEQRRIADILDKADAIRRKRKEAIALTEELLRSAFLEMFGDPVTNPKGWEVKPLGEVVHLHAGNSLPPGVPFTGQDGGVLLLKVGDMNAPGNEAAITRAREWSGTVTGAAIVAPEGSVVIPKRGGAIGTNKKRVLVRPAALDPNLMAITPTNALDLTYLRQWFDGIDLMTLSNGSAIPQLNKKDLAPLKIPVPPLNVQKRFATIGAAVRRLRDHADEGVRQASILFDGLVHRAFEGQFLPG